MINHRSVRGAMMVALAVILLTGRAEADEPAEPPRAWLAQPVAAPVVGREESPSPWRIGGMVVLLGGIAAAAVYAKRHQKRARGLPDVPDLSVVGAVRVGNKAQLVLASVAGKLVLLGVTESNVRKVAWIETESMSKAVRPEVPAFGNLLDGLLDETTEGESSEESRIHALAPQVEAVFGAPRERLAFGSSETSTTALELAGRTHDSIEISTDITEAKRRAKTERKSRPEPNAGIEGQARGLRTRRQGRRA